MQKSVMIAIQPRWVEKIVSGEKTVEVRKTRPNCEVPFKCYIYCSAKDYEQVFGVDKFMHKIFLNGKGKGKVIGEFVCDRIIDIPHKDLAENFRRLTHDIITPSCLKVQELKDYLGCKDGYGWHITDLVVYDEPRELSDFKHECNAVCVDTKKQIKCERITVDGFSCNGLKPITRPPMSWQFCVATEPRQTAD